MSAAARRFTAGYYLANAGLLASVALVHAAFTPIDEASAPEQRGRITTLAQLYAWVSLQRRAAAPGAGLPRRSSAARSGQPRAPV